MTILFGGRDIPKVLSDARILSLDSLTTGSGRPITENDGSPLPI